MAREDHEHSGTAVAASPRQIDGPSEHAQDVRLMHLVGAGDARARAMLAQRLCGRVRRLLRGLLGSADDADDAAQDALVAILHAAASYRGDASIERWADRIAVRTGLRFRRRQRRVSVVLDAEAALSDRGDDTGQGDRLARPLLAYLDELPAKERRVLFLKHALGYSLPEVAELVGAARSTTKYRLASALERIRKAIRRDVAIGRKGAGPR